jgi:hypothetical protein
MNEIIFYANLYVVIESFTAASASLYFLFEQVYSIRSRLVNAPRLDRRGIIQISYAQNRFDDLCLAFVRLTICRAYQTPNHNLT